MQKRKNGPPLFELLNEGEGDVTATIKTPESWKANQLKIRPAPKLRVSSAPIRETRPSTGGKAQTVSESVPLFGLDGQRIRVSLTSLGAAGVLFAALVLLLGSFELGSRSGRHEGLEAGYEAGRASFAADASRAIETARARPLGMQRSEQLLEEPVGATQSSTASMPGAKQEVPSSGWIRDYTYIVAQGFGAGLLDDADKAQRFLADHGITTELVRFPSGAGQLITVRGYNHVDATQKQLAEQFLDKVRAVGAKYFAEGGGYKLEGYFKTLKEASW